MPTPARAVEMRSREEAEGYLVCLVRHGAMQVQGSFGERSIQAGQGLIAALSELSHTRLAAGAQLIEFVLPQGLMRDLAAQCPRFEPLIGSQLAGRLRALAGEAGSAADPRWLEEAASAVMQQQPLRTTTGPRAPGRATPASIRRALDFMAANLPVAIGLQDVAQAAGLSISSLGRAFKRQFGKSPMALLRELRLDRLHDELRRGDGPERIRDLALRWRFRSASQFSQAYRRRFGEKPSETAARVRS
ncbi:helix-turn-helix transcriptional regulator, partial [Pelomonas sp. KK5]|uniref:helix-turn-helix transcriptional regulator n=1 Tax=Pelomonas sp. KK5 TaxID=1855730 RepID=UPI001180F4DD